MGWQDAPIKGGAPKAPAASAPAPAWASAPVKGQPRAPAGGTVPADPRGVRYGTTADGKPMFTQQVLTAPKRGFLDRMIDSGSDMIRHFSPVAAFSRAVTRALPLDRDYDIAVERQAAAAGGFTPRTTEQLQAERRAQLIQQERNERAVIAGRAQDDPAWRGKDGTVVGNVARVGADLLGGMAGGMISDPTNLIAPGGSFLKQALSQAAIGAVADASLQGYEMGEGVRDNYDGLQTVVSAAGGPVLMSLLKAPAGVRALRDWWTGRGVDTGRVSDEDLVSGSLDGSLDPEGKPVDVDTVLRQAGADPAQFSSPDVAARFADRARAAQERQPFNQSAKIARERGEMEARITNGETDASWLQAPVVRTVPDDVVIKGTPDGLVRSDDLGAEAGRQRHNAASENVLATAEKHAERDPVLREILDSGLSRDAKIGALYGRIKDFMDEGERMNRDPINFPEPNRADEYARPEPTTPFNEPTPERARTRGQARPAAGLPSDIVTFFRKKGYSEHQAKGITAGIVAESRGDHTARGPVIEGRVKEGALGLGQWLGSRREAIIKRYGPNPSREQQLEFIHYELQGGDGGGRAVLASRDEGEALDAYIKKFMRPAAGKETSGDIARGRAALGLGEVEAPDVYRAPAPKDEPFTNNPGFERTSGTYKPTDDELAAGYRRDPNDAMATGSSDRPFKDDPSAPDGKTWEQRYEEQSEALRKEYEASASKRREREQQGEASGNPDPSQRYGANGYGQKPHKADGAEHWSMDADGHIADANGKPVAFRTAKEAAKWAAKNEMGGDFELHSWGANSSRIVLRRREGSTYGQPRPTGPAEPAAGRSADDSQRLIGGGEKASDVKPEAPAAEQPAPAQPKRYDPADYTERAGDSLPNPRKGWKGGPDAEVEVAKGPDGQFYHRSSYTDGDNGSARPFGHSEGFPTREAAMAAGYDKLRETLPTGEGRFTTTTQRNQVARIRAWLENKPTAASRAPGGEVSARPAPQPEARIPDTAPTGKSEKVVTARGREVDTRFRVMEADDLVTSDKPGYLADLQPRDRAGRASSDAQVADIASKLDPERLHSSRLAAQGAPIVGPDRMVETGNGRIAALRRAFDEHPERAEAYRQMIAKQGFDVSGMKRPILVRERVGDMSTKDRAAFAVEANERDTMSMSPAEQALTDARNLSDEALELYRGGDIDLARNREFVMRFLKELVPPSEHNSFVQPDGSMSRAGAARVEAALLSKAYDNPRLVAEMTESTDTDIKAIGGALTDVAPEWARMRAAAKEGSIAPEADITDAVNEAVRLVSVARQKGDKIADIMAQSDMFSGKTVSPEVEGVLRLMFNPEFSRATSRVRLEDGLRRYVRQAMETRPDGGLFGEKAPASIEMLAAAKEGADGAKPGQQGDLLKAASGRAGSSASAPRGDGAQGSRLSREGGDGARGDGDAGGNAVAERLRELDEKVPDKGGHVYRVASPGETRTVTSVESARRVAAELAQRSGTLDKHFDDILAFKGGKASFGDVTVEHGPFAHFSEMARKLWSDEGGALNLDAIVDTDGLIRDAKKLRDIIGKPTGAMKAVGSPMKRMVSAAMFTNDSRIRSLAAKFKSDALTEFADLFHAQAGKGDATGRTYHEAVTRQAAIYTQRTYEALAPFLSKPEALSRIRDLLAAPNRSMRATEAERAAAANLREALKDAIEYRKEAGEDIGEVTDGYFPRILDVQAVAKDREGFLKAATNLYRQHGADDPVRAAQDWFGHIMDTYAGLDGAIGFGRVVGGGMGSKTAKAREFGKAADVALKDFYQGDVFHTLTSYFSGAAKRAEYSRRFGRPGREGSATRKAWIEKHGDAKTQIDVLTDRIKEDVRASQHEPDGVLQVVQSVLASNLGHLGSSDPFVRNMTSYVHAWNQLSKMDRTLITSLGELTMGFVRGGPRYGFGFVAETAKQFVRQLRGAAPDDAARWGEVVGVATDAMVSQAMTSRITMDHSSAGVQKMMAGYYKAIGLHQFTEGERIASVKMARKMLNVFAGDLQSSKPRVRNRAALYLRELGIKDPEAFGKTLRERGFTHEEVLRDQGDAAIYGTALLRLANQTVMMPSRAERPTWASHPVGGLVFSLMGYSYAFKKNVLDRATRLGAQAFKDKDPTLLAPAFGLSILAAFQAFNDTVVRPALFGSGYDFSTETPMESAMRVADRAGFTGGFSPILNAIKGVRYDRSLAESISGPAIGSVLSATQKIAIEPFSSRNSPNTNTAERNAAAAFYDTVIEPGIDAFGAARLKGAARAAVVLGTGNKRGGMLPGDKDAFVDAVAGEKQDAS